MQDLLAGWNPQSKAIFGVQTAGHQLPGGQGALPPVWEPVADAGWAKLPHILGASTTCPGQESSTVAARRSRGLHLGESGRSPGPGAGPGGRTRGPASWDGVGDGGGAEFQDSCRSPRREARAQTTVTTASRRLVQGRGPPARLHGVENLQTQVFKGAGEGVGATVDAIGRGRCLPSPTDSCWDPQRLWCRRRLPCRHGVSVQRLWTRKVSNTLKHLLVPRA